MQGQNQQIDEAPEQEEEGESQDLVNSRNTQHHYQQQPSNQVVDENDEE